MKRTMRAGLPAVLAGIVGLCAAGCSLTKYGPAFNGALWQDSRVKHFAWERTVTDTNGVRTAESIELEGFQRDQTTGANAAIQAALQLLTTLDSVQSDSLRKAIQAAVAAYKPTTSPTTAPDATNAPAGATGASAAVPVIVDGTVWTAYDSPAFYAHGVPGEDAYREAAIAAAVAGGYDCIRVRCVEPPSDEPAVHLLHWRSPVDGEFKLGTANWTTRCAAAGITRWQWDVTEADATQRARWKLLGADYTGETLQVLDQGKVIRL